MCIDAQSQSVRRHNRSEESDRALRSATRRTMRSQAGASPTRISLFGPGIPTISMSADSVVQCLRSFTPRVARQPIYPRLLAASGSPGHLQASSYRRGCGSSRICEREYVSACSMLVPLSFLLFSFFFSLVFSSRRYPTLGIVDLCFEALAGQQPLSPLWLALQGSQYIRVSLRRRSDAIDPSD